eukprot:TRINITY_DN25583_c0_g1_i1.p1 TRINITY_DN25583_c0_g1~~TRINITY_DN25583_c0_g1_i1.p1  ORF type:complete len:789 (+),score=53.72 TRINITY_DN25583_c0_g1_i1:41-2368(+)
MALDCWQGGFNFEMCCVMQTPSCWAFGHTYESCCGPSALPLRRVLGNPGCWMGGSFNNVFTWEECCLPQNERCWGGVGSEFTFARCCGSHPLHEDFPLVGVGAVGISRQPTPKTVLSGSPWMPSGTPSCNESLANLTLNYWDTTRPGATVSQQVWSFDALVSITSIEIFMLPGLQEFVAPFEGRFNLIVDAGQGWRDYWGEFTDFLVASPGGQFVFEHFLLEPFEAVRIGLVLKEWRGSAALLYALPRGCNVASPVPSVSVIHCWPRTGIGEALSPASSAKSVSNDSATASSVHGHMRADTRRAVKLLEHLFGWQVVSFSASTVGECFLRMDAALRELESQNRTGYAAVVLLSPLLVSFHLQQHGLMMKNTVFLFSEHPPDALSVVGFPRVGSNGSWHWSLRKVRHQFWKLLYSDYPTGSSRSLLRGAGSQICHGGDAVSGTRIYRPNVLRDILAHVDAVPDAGWLVNLDLEAMRQGHHERTFVCPLMSIEEEDYLQYTDLTRELATRYEVEVARFHPSSELKINCVFSVRFNEIFSQLGRFGLTMPWCFRWTLREGWQVLAGWWKGLSTSHFVVPSDGTALALVRNLREPIPWDHDIDVHLFSEVNAGDLMNALLEWTDEKHKFEEQRHLQPEAVKQLRALGFSWEGGKDYRQRGGGLHIPIAYTPRTGRPVPVQVVLDVIFSSAGTRASFPFTVEFAGVATRWSNNMQRLTTRKYRSAKKLTRNNSYIRCKQEDHNGCLPACEEPADGEYNAHTSAQFVICDFPPFVEIDVFH